MQISLKKELRKKKKKSTKKNEKNQILMNSNTKEIWNLFLFDQ